MFSLPRRDQAGCGILARVSDLPQLLASARELLPDVIRLRRVIHGQPEVGLALPRTQEAVLTALAGTGLQLHSGDSTSSVVAVLAGAQPGPTVLLRADMDGLPLTEATGLDFAPAAAGTMHACGHDLHTAMLVGAARLLAARREEIAGQVVFAFQPGEEGYHGARQMLAEGLLEAAGTPVSTAFALHVTTAYPAGTIHLRPGAQLAASDELRITVTGRGGHASAPHAACDPIPVACEIVQALQSFVTRRVSIFDPAVISITHIVAGTTDNIIPETAFLEGTIRTLSEATRAMIHQQVPALIERVAAAHGASAAVTVDVGYPVTRNDPDFTDLVRRVAGSLVGADQVSEPTEPIMGAEDFSYILAKVPGAMAFLGACPPEEDPARAPANHSNRVIFDEESMAVGIALHAAMALEQLRPRP